MSLKNRSMYAILGICSLSKSSGYDIKKYSDTVLTGFWSENFGHIYPTLKAMLQEGLLSEEKKETENKVFYSITEKGKEELSNWLMEDTYSQPIRSEFLLKLLFSDANQREQLSKVLFSYREGQETTRNDLKRKLDELDLACSKIAPERKSLYRAILRKSILVCEANLSWCEETERELLG